MAKYIKLEALKERFAKQLVWLKRDVHDQYSLGLYDGCEYDANLIDEILVEDVAPVVHGRWEYIPQTLNTLSQLRCPFCGWWSLDPSIDSAYNYCPNCGAKMDGGDHSAEMQ